MLKGLVLCLSTILLAFPADARPKMKKILMVGNKLARWNIELLNNIQQLMIGTYEV